ncbi:hypothetical protein BGX33_007815 [Mortierella sp. NVP41]|nr:hypothetical protein BGX33_007815 [Mortierella sp. NVP41]
MFSHETEGDEAKDEIPDLTEADYDVLPTKNYARSSNSAVRAGPVSDDFGKRELNVLADEIAAHYRQIQENKTLESYDPLLILPLNARLLQVWMEWIARMLIPTNRRFGT